MNNYKGSSLRFRPGRPINRKISVGFDLKGITLRIQRIFLLDNLEEFGTKFNFKKLESYLIFTRISTTQIPMRLT